MNDYNNLNIFIRFLTLPILIIAGPSSKKFITLFYPLILIFYIINLFGFLILTLILLF
jgi:hypothetical protein